MRGFRAAEVAGALLIGLGVGTSEGQDMPPMPAPSPPPAQTAPAPAATAPIIPAMPAAKLSGAQLDQVVAPVALYPDPLLAQVLMAATYPVQIVEAARWSRVPANRALASPALEAALRGQGWDPSVMGLVPFPQVLAAIADNIGWTQQLGVAVLDQPADVITTVQRLRHAAVDAGSLKATPECHCIIQTSGELIAILPSDADLVSIPVYNSVHVYGRWPNPDHPPVSFSPPGSAAPAGAAIAFTPAIEVALYGPLWGWASMDWPRSRILVDNTRYAAAAPGHPAFSGGVWVHDSTPRRILAAGTHPVVAHNRRRAHVPAREKKLAMVRPPHQFATLRHRSSALPPGTILPPPPPPHHAALGWPYNHFAQY